MIYQIKCNESTRVPGQHICCQVAWLSEQSSIDKRVTVRRFQSVSAVRFRVERGRRTREQAVYHESIEDWWEWLYSQLRAKIGTWIWCDGLTDHLVLLGALKEMEQGRLIYKRSVMSSRVGFLRCETERGSCLWLDRCNWWRCPIDDLCASVGFYSDLNAEKASGLPCGPIRCKAIVLCLSVSVTALCRFIVEHDCGCLRVTAAGQSLAAYRHKYGPRRTIERWSSCPSEGNGLKPVVRLWPRRHDNADALNLERGAYYGGPTHCYYIGAVTTPVHILDTRSIYPYVMRQGMLPAELLEVENEPALETVRERLGLDCGLARIRLRTDMDVYPVRWDRFTAYVRGDYETYLSGPELACALKRGHVGRIYQIAWYRQMDLFSRFVDHFFRCRIEAERCGQTVWSEVAKLILNSLASKFGQLSGEWRDDAEAISEQPWGYWYEVNSDTGTARFCRGIAGRVQTKEAVTEAAHSFPAIPAYVCSLARVLMDERLEIGRKAGRVYYSAVDSIHCDDAAANALIVAGVVGNGLGQLRQKCVARSAEYRGIGDYSLDGAVTRSGLPALAVPACQFCKLPLPGCSKICPGCKSKWNGTTWSYSETECAAEVISHGPADELFERKQTIRLPHSYRFGRVGQDGWVIPWYLERDRREMDLTNGIPVR